MRETAGTNDFVVSFEICLEKILGKGEDAEPILDWWGEKEGLLGVFDGLGGAGSAIYEENGSVHSGAYHASRIARRIVLDSFVNRRQSKQSKNSEGPYQSFVDDLRSRLAAELQKKAGQLEKNPSKLRSSLIRRLPTTLVVMHLWENECNHCFNYLSIWAGDSRGYVLDLTGLHQLTQDDIKSRGDALDNLLNDSPLSNYANADTDFDLHHSYDCADLPCIFIVATDGCFGYVPTPMHFEHLLLNSLLMAKNEQEWQISLATTFAHIAGDDVSMALVAVGWPSFDSLRHSFFARYEVVHDHYIRKLDEIDQMLRNQTQVAEHEIKEKEEMRMKLWTEYKVAYEGLHRSDAH